MTCFPRVTRSGWPLWAAVACAACFGLLAPAPVNAHEVRPAFLAFREQAPDVFEVLFKTPMQGDLRLALFVSVSGDVERLSPVLSRPTKDAMVQTWKVRVPGSLAGRQLRIEGLEKTLADALLRIDYLDGRAWTQRLTPAAPQAVAPARPNAVSVAKTYGALGVEHILSGFDHLLFVLGLIFLSRGTRRLFFAVTAFTFAHSLTLAAATLGLVHVPQKPIEAVIALSIVFVASEIVKLREGRGGIAARAPWLVAFAFGLLHGFGFAGALSEIGVPEGSIPAALLFFNLGVEAGQIAFVALVLAGAAIVRRAWSPLPAWGRLVPPYLIGSLATFWLIQRVAQV